MDTPEMCVVSFNDRQSIIDGAEKLQPPFSGASHRLCSIVQRQLDARYDRKGFLICNGHPAMEAAV